MEGAFLEQPIDTESQATKQGLVYLSCYLSSKAKGDALTAEARKAGCRAFTVRGCGGSWIVYGDQRFNVMRAMPGLEKDKRKFEKAISEHEQTKKCFLDKWETNGGNLMKTFEKLQDIKQKRQDLNKKPLETQGLEEEHEFEEEKEPETQEQDLAKLEQETSETLERLLQNYGLPALSATKAALEKDYESYRRARNALSRCKSKLSECEWQLNYFRMT